MIVSRLGVMRTLYLGRMRHDIAAEKQGHRGIRCGKAERLRDGRRFPFGSASEKKAKKKGCDCADRLRLTVHFERV